MPIKKECWIVECDYCKELLNVHDSVDWSCFHTEEDAKQALGDDGEWGYDEANPSMIICPECRDRRMREEETCEDYR